MCTGDGDGDPDQFLRGSRFSKLNMSANILFVKKFKKKTQKMGINHQNLNVVEKERVA